MSAEENKALVRQFWAEADRKVFAPADVDRLLSPDLAAHLPGAPQPLDRQAFLEFTKVFARGFPDYHHVIEDLFGEGDRVAVRVTWRGTHTGEFQGLPPTGRRGEMPGLAILRIANGKIAEMWSQFDVMGLLQQLGAIPGATADATAPTTSAPM